MIFQIRFLIDQKHGLIRRSEDELEAVRNLIEDFFQTFSAVMLSTKILYYFYSIKNLKKSIIVLQ